MGLTLVKTHTPVTLLQENNEQYRLVRDFNFIILLRSVSEDLLKRMFPDLNAFLKTWVYSTDTFVNKFSNLSALVAQTF